MTETTDTKTVTRFPAAKLADATEALAAVHKRLTKAAARANQTAPEAPSLEVVASYTEIACPVCRRAGVFGQSTKDGECAWKECEGTYVAREFVDIEVSVSKPALAGWEFLASVEPLVGGNLIRKMPGADTEGFSFDKWRTGDIACDHCQKVRRRNETFLVRADGTSAEVPLGTVKQVGRQCLADFLGGASPASILGQLSYAGAVRAVGEEAEGSWGGGGWRDTTEDPTEFLTWTSSVVRLDGWVSKAAAMASDKQSTAGQVSYLMSPPWGGFETRTKWQKDRETYRPDESDKERAAKVLAWAAALPGKSDYEANLALVAKQPRIEPGRHGGILASAVSAYERELGRTLAKARETKAPSTHQGTVGERKVFTLTVERVADFDTMYGVQHLHKMRDEAGNAFVWKTGSDRIEPGTKVTGKATVKAHSEYQGEPQTELARCKFE